MRPKENKKLNSKYPYDEAESWCHKVIQSRDNLLFDPVAFHKGILNAAQKLGYSYEAMDSLLRHIHLNHIKKRIYKIRGNISYYILQYCHEGKSIVDLSKQASYTPYMMARQILENLTTSNKGKKFITDAMRNPEIILNCNDIDTILRPEYLHSESVVSSATISPSTIIKQSIDPFSLMPIVSSNDDKKCMTRIAMEIIYAINKDPLYGPRHDKQRRTIGLEHEILLEQALHSMNIPFETEADLRIKGTSRTPDILLLYPIGVRIPITQTGKHKERGDHSHIWRTICWIDSKAMFGDVQTHHSETLPQAEAFVHRFGPGLIIYWYGHAPTDRLSNGYGDVSIMSHLPEFATLPSGQFRFQGGDYPVFSMSST